MRPQVTLAYAQTLDGYIAASDGSSRWISGHASLLRTHAQRASHDAIMVGVGTVVADNPRLTVRLVQGRNPIRVIIDGRLRIPDDAAVIQPDMAAGTWIICGPDADVIRRRALTHRGVIVLPVAADPFMGGVHLTQALTVLGHRGIRSVMLEGGSRLITSMVRTRLVDRVAITIAPKLLGAGTSAIGDIGITTMADALTLTSVQSHRLDDDIWIEGSVRYE
jgi:5-amino-6-(5-phosphoribosylamino)uracil reductase/diaminohydroxyphosphoribosylaminopyrimidine deaminase/5-amino-6-(5-phosphoribosylamino)uracil reductase